MRALWIVLLLAGCSADYLKAMGDGMRGAGGAMSEDVYRAQNGLPESRKTDNICMMDCTKRYSWAYCERQCSY